MKQFYAIIIFFLFVESIEAQFVFKVETTTANESFTIPVKSGESYSYQIIYTKAIGDIPRFLNSTGSRTLTFDDPGIHTISINRIPGDISSNSHFPAIYFNNSGDKDKIVSIEQWGSHKWTTMENAFYGCTNLVINANDTPNLSNVTNLDNMFKEVTAFQDKKGTVGNWNLSTITSMQNMFEGVKIPSDDYNAILDGWATADASESIPTNITVNFGTSVYTGSADSWNILKNTYLWSIEDYTDAFITTWRTNAPNQDIRLLVGGTDILYDVDWGDGTTSTSITGIIDHTYTNAGIYTVVMRGKYPYFVINNNTISRDKILSIEQWGNQEWSSFERSFWGCSNVVINATDVPNLSNVTSLDWMFYDATSMVDNGGTIGSWDTGNVQQMERMFRNTSSFNSDIGNWNVSNVQTFNQIFQNASNFNQNLGNWNLSSAVNMGRMFTNANISKENYDSTLIGWATASVGETVPRDINLSGTTLQYCAGALARNQLQSDYNWSITGDSFVCDESDKFIMKWVTTTPNQSITIPTIGTGYDYTVEWGDGTMESNITGNASHTYTNAGTHTIKIAGTFPRIYFNDSGDKDKIITIEQWGTQNWKSMVAAFRGCTNLVINASDAPNLSDLTSLANMFRNCSNLGSPNLSNWDVSKITSVSGMFLSASNFNGNISNWDVGNINNYEFMFAGTHLFNQDISTWNIGERVSGNISMRRMFSGAVAFNKPIENWEMNKVTNMAQMFNRASIFNQSLSSWNVSNVIEMQGMFVDASEFDQSLGNWNIESTVNMTNIFNNTGLSVDNYETTLQGWATLNIGETKIPTNIDLGVTGLIYCDNTYRYILKNDYTWTLNGDVLDCPDNIKFITTFQTTSDNESITIPTFSGETYEYQVDWGDGTIENNITGNGVHTYTTVGIYTVKIVGLFPRIYFNNAPISHKILTVEQWGTNKWTSMENAFHRCQNLKIVASDIPDLSNVTKLNSMFINCRELEGTNLSNWDVSTIEEVNSMFSGASSFNADITNWNVSNIRDFRNMFLTAASFNQNLGNWDISNATNMGSMLRSSGLSVENYDATLIGWSTLNIGETQIPANISLGANTLKYCEGITARNTLTSAPYNWNVNDNGAGCDFSEGFITTWKTTTANESITIPTAGNGYNYLVDWGDGTIESGNTGNASHVYTNAGVYIVKIKGDFPRIYFNNIGDKDKITSIDQWGTQQWTSMENAFYGCSILELNVSDTPDLSLATSTARMFMGTMNIVDNEASMNSWNTSTITNMSNMFANSIFDFNISEWNVGNVTNFFRMFDGNTAFNQNIGNWNIGENVVGTINMSGMFKDTHKFNQPLGSWNMSKVASMNGMFFGAKLFNQSIETWNVNNVVEFISMFENTEVFDQNLEAWNISSAVSMNDMFKGANLSVENYDATLIGWAALDVGETKIPVGIDFNAAEINYCLGETARNILTGVPYNWNIVDGGLACRTSEFFITTWQTTSDNESITIPTAGTGYNYIVDWGDGTIEGGATGDVTHTYTTSGDYTVRITGDFPRIFFNNSGDKNKIISIDQWGDIEWQNMAQAFNGCTNLKLRATDLPNLNEVTNAIRMFAKTSNFEDLGGMIGQWNTGNIDTMNAMFISSGFNEDIGNWDVSKVVNFDGMFYDCQNFDQNLGNWDLSEAVSMRSFITTTSLATSSFSLENYDKTLKGWATLSTGETRIPLNLNVDVNLTRYCDAYVEHHKLITDYNWNISDLGLGCPENEKFITTWQVTDGATITIPVSNGETYSYIVEWGDNTTSVVTDDTAPSHTYINGRVYTIKITGDFPRIHFDNGMFTDYIKSVEQWGTQQWTSMEDAFRGCDALVINATDTPDLSQATNLSFMFSSCKNIGEPDFSSWNTETITNMRHLFSFSRFNGNISTWNVGKVTSFNSMFRDDIRFNQDISQWNIGEFVTGNIDMTEMFRTATKFNQSINNWDVSKVNNMHRMFHIASKYNQPMGNWDVSNVQFMNEMFSKARNFNQDLTSWNISNVSTMLDMLIDTSLSQENYDNTLRGWATLTGGETQIPTGIRLDVSATYCLGEIARNTLTSTPYNWTINDGGRNCDFSEGFITTWETTTVNESITIPTTGNGYFFAVDWGDGTQEFGVGGNPVHEYVTAGSYTVKIIGNFPRIFFNDNGDKNKILSVEQWGNIQWTSMERALAGCRKLIVNATDAPDLSNVTSTFRMFYRCNGLGSPDFSNWNTATITNMNSMFAFSPFNGNITTWNVGEVITFQSMFFNNLKFNQNINNWNIGEFVTGTINMSSMFRNAREFNQPLNFWDVSKVVNMSRMFHLAGTFNQPVDNWNVSNVIRMDQLFQQAKSFNQSLATWDISSVNDMRTMLTGSNLSVANYDVTLEGWARLDVGETQIPTTIEFDATNLYYCLGENSRNILTSVPYDWKITDAGRSCTNQVIWTGIKSSNWNDNDNWYADELPLTTSEVLIPETVNNPVVGKEIVAEVKSMELEGAATLSIAEEGTVIVEEDLKANEIISIDSSNDASGILIVRGTSDATIKYKRAGLKANEWSIVGAPVTGQTIKEFIENPSNNVRVNTTVTPNRYAVGYYDDDKPAGTKWTYYTGDEIITNALTFENGKGNIVSRATNGNITFIGNLVVNDRNITVQRGNWNAIGNPYTAYLPINNNAGENFLQTNMNRLNPAYVGIYVWDTSQNKYVAKTLVSSAATLPVGQGFFVKMKSTNGTIIFREAQRIHDSANLELFSRGIQQVPTIEILAKQDELTVNTTIKYYTTATKELDPGYDVGNYGGTNFDVYTHLLENSEDRDFTIQSLPTEDYSNSIIPLGITSEAGKTIQITALDENLPKDISIYLEDKETGSFVQINEGESYTFKTSEGIQGVGRFYIHTKAKVLTIDDLSTLDNVTIFKSGKQEITVQGLQNGEKITVKLFSLLGSEVYNEELTGANSLTIRPTEVEVGVYLVRIATDRGIKTKKVVFKK